MTAENQLFSVVGSVRHVRDSYRRFVLSTYRLADAHLREQFEHHVNEADTLVKGPFVTLARDFESGRPLTDLVAEGVAHQELLRLNWNFGANPLYAHQEQSLRAVAAGRNIVVKTGTGSGKTESFLLPVLDGVARQREQGVRGLKAILLYPMNALANDQLTRLRTLLGDTGTGITFALYTGDSEKTAKELQPPPVDGIELIDKEAIRKNPPDILLTNYKQLEFLLIRKKDRGLFSPALRFLVLDEIHTYRGALATEMACLLRRLKARCELAPGSLRCLGTSATVSQDAGGDASLARFVTDLFGEPFAAGDIVGETMRPAVPPANPWDPPWVTVSEQEIDDASDESCIFRLAEKVAGRKTPSTGPLADRIGTIFEGNRLVTWLNETATTPTSLEELAKRMAVTFPDSASLSLLDRQRLLEVYFLVGSAGAEDATPTLRPKFHSFFHGVYDVGLCMNPQCRELVRDGSEKCPKCQSVVRPAVLCRTCGQDYVKVRFHEDDPHYAAPNDDFASDENTAFVTPFICGDNESEDDEDEAQDAEPAEPAAKQRRGRKNWRQEWVDHKSGKVFGRVPSDTAGMSLQHVLRGKGNTCPVCGGTYTRGDILTLLRTGAAATTSVLSTHHLDRLPGERRKMLVFADNRQEAAHQAGYMTGRHREFALRHALARLVAEAGPDGLALNMVAHRLLERFQEMGIAGKRLTVDERKFWLKALEFEAAGEFCLSGHQRTSLENLAIIEVQYEFLNELATAPGFVESCTTAGIRVDDGLHLARAILDNMRRRRAVAFGFYQRYLDPTTAGWAELTQEPYNVTFPEREVRPVFFVRERSEAAKNNPGGSTFFSFLKDSDKGAKSFLPKLIDDRAGLGASGPEWTRQLIGLLAEKEILMPVRPSARKAQEALGGGTAYQINPRFIRLTTANTGWRCQRCQIWRPYRGRSCYGSSRCRGDRADLKPAALDRARYYERLYLDAAPRRLRAKEHTAQIAQEDRAKLETELKEGRLEALVCSPTLELGVNIGTLDTVLLRNAPPTPANYVQRAGRAGRSHRIGFVSTFCGVGPHDRHCFEDPPWLVRGEFSPPTVKLDNERIVARHVRSFLLEEAQHDLPGMLQELLDDLQNPTEWNKTGIKAVADEIRARQSELTDKASRVFGAPHVSPIMVSGFPDELLSRMEMWFQSVKRLFTEWQEWLKILSDRYSRQKARARERAYRDLTQDPERAHVLTYLADNGVLPSYQFPTDTFSLDPGVGDTPTLRRPAWVGLFEFAPGNLVYANGHKLKSIRGFFEGSRKGTGTVDGAGGGRVQRYFFCPQCGVALSTMCNACPSCQAPMNQSAEVASLETFEAEENTQITSGEESRERVTFDRKENIVFDPEAKAIVFPWEFASLELRHGSTLLITNWGKKRFGTNQPGAGFQLCPTCGRHKPDALPQPTKASQERAKRWDDDHARFCKDRPSTFVLGYEFRADSLVVPIAPIWLAQSTGNQTEALLKTLGTALVSGATEFLELEPDEIAHFVQGSDAQGWTLVFYETVPGGAGYLERLASSFASWAQAAHNRLFNHECAGACYRCLKSYRNQFLHSMLDKRLVIEVLFQFSGSEMSAAPTTEGAGKGALKTAEWYRKQCQERTEPDSPIEAALLDAIRASNQLPLPTAQREFRNHVGTLITIADFAFEAERVAVYCDGFEHHANIDTLESDASKRNYLQSIGWKVVTFWGRTILRHPDRCVRELARTVCTSSVVHPA